MAQTVVERIILVPLANNAVLGDGRYVDIGDNTKARIDDAIAYAENIYGKRIAWVFGAGTDVAYTKGKTLAYLSQVYLKQKMSDASVFANEDDKIVFGTYEEMKWAIRRAYLYYPHDKLSFVFFSQPRQLLRGRLIRRLFFPGVKARFEPTKQTREIPWKHEGAAYLRLIAIKLRIVAPRW